MRTTKDSPAYLRVDGKPVVYLYQVPFAPKLNPETFGQRCRGVEAAAGPVYWKMEALLPAHPGHDNSGFRPDDLFVVPRDDGATRPAPQKSLT